MNKSDAVVSTRLELIREKFGQSRSFRSLIQEIENGTREIPVSGLAGSSAAILLAEVAEKTGKPIAAIASDPERAEDLHDDLAFLLGEDAVGLFPDLGIPPFEFRSPAAETVAKRISTLSRLKTGSLKIAVSSLEAIMEPTMSLAAFEASSLHLKVGQEISLIDVAEMLTLLGFRRVPLVEEIGDYAQRGGLIDFFSPGFENPIRVEFFGDQIETIRQFEVPTQRTAAFLKEVKLLPRREISVTPDTVEKFLERLPADDADLIRARYLNDPELPGLEWLAGLFGIEQGCFLDYVPEDAIIYFQDKRGINDTCDKISHEAERHRERLQERLTNIPEVSSYYRNREGLSTLDGNRVSLNHLPFRDHNRAGIDFDCREHPAFGSRLDLLGGTIQEFYTGGVDYLIAADGVGQAERLQQLLSEKITGMSPLPVEVALLKGGFVSPANRIAILTDHEIFGRYFRRTRRKKFKEGVAIQSYTSLVEGDYVVHTDYGIAQFIGLKTLNVDGRQRDCLLLKYAEGDKLYVPIEEFNRVSRYAGKDGAPRLTPLGGPTWEKTKAKTRQAIEAMAAELIRLYAERKTRPGFAFGPDTVWMRQLETSFIYEETPDQQRAIDAIKVDMERATPMDRLVCGDVGYGKTEVAVRAAFKTVEAGKQVAVLVPTTILAQQHLNTFAQRLADFPVKVEMLSRFRTRKEQTAIIEALKKGNIDVIIGTHRLLSKDVAVPNLGLLVIDEEQRFGVRHKETLRQLKTQVDTIALTATPIPRTLQMSLMGVRDMSLINTSPRDRLPITTQISEFGPEVIYEAVMKEIDRGGQVFFVHNRVQTIEAMHHYLQKLLPHIEIGVAHGQMHERSLEGIMLAFLARRFQVLLCTSIIESGLDIPSVNTIVINRADRFGLAQLYQLRGRVGRSSVRAQAVLLVPPYHLLKDDARKRLRAIEAHADLGSGFALAMKDLEIRGAGNILGPQQSGFIEEVGFDLYTRLLEEAVATLKGEEIQRPPEIRLEVDLELYIPDDYIGIREQKVEVYQKLAGAARLEEVEHLRDNITDRFGRPPETVSGLFDAAAVRISAAANQIEKMTMTGGRVELTFKEARQFARKDVEAWRRATDKPLEFSFGRLAVITLDLGQVAEYERLAYLRAVLNRV